MTNLTYFRDYAEFETVYKKYMDGNYPIYYMVSYSIEVYDEPKNIFQKLFKHFRTYNSICSRELLPVTKITAICPMIDKVDIEYINRDGERRYARVEPENLYFYRNMAEMIGCYKEEMEVD